MIKSGPSILRASASGLLLLTAFTGCVFPAHYHGPRTPDRAFIEYWPAPKQPGRVRLAVKDLMDMKGIVTSAGSQYILEHNIPAPRDAACLKGAREQNALIVGKTNLSELAVAPSGLNRYFGTPRNPLNRKVRLIPGGSSSGAAVAVADDLADVAYGTDTAGSIRLPAACCGVVGLKTTYGLIPLKGVFPIDPKHLDTVGPLARNIANTAVGMNMLVPGFSAKYREAIAEKPSARQIRVGRLYIPGTDPRIDQAVDDSLRRTGFKIVRLNENFRAAWTEAEHDGTVVAAGGAWASDKFWADKPGVTARTKAVLLLGEVTYNTVYWPALKRRPQWRRALRNTLRHVDCIALPTLKTLPPRIPPFLGSPLFESRVAAMENTFAVNFGGNPALAMPVPINDKVVPVTSLELVGRLRGEAALLNVGRLVEAARTDPHKPTP